MARPKNARITSTTSTGIEFQWLLDGYTSRWARDGAVEVVSALVNWADAEAFQRDAVGFTRWDGVAPTLQRHIPLECPLRSGMFCDDIQLEDFGTEPDRTDYNDPLNGNRPVQDWAIYRLTFKKPKYKVLTDAQLAALAPPLEVSERFRFCTQTLMPRPRERVVSGHGFCYLPPGLPDNTPYLLWKPIAEEKTFIPEHQIEITISLLEWPIGAVPIRTIERCMTTVNAKPIQFIEGGRTWDVGELLFKGLGSPIDVYSAADNSPVVDLTYLWCWQPGGWNNYLAINPDTGARSFQPLRHRFSVPLGAEPPRVPPYNGESHRDLFIPGT